MQLLEAQNVTRVFGGGLLSKGQTVAVDEISLRVNEEKPTIIAIAGESGSGKTTLARLLLGVIQPTSGSIRFRGQNLTEMNGRERKEFRRQVQAIFQDPFEVYNPFYKVDEVLTTPVKKFRLAANRAEAQQRIEESLQMAGLRPEETLECTQWASTYRCDDSTSDHWQIQPLLSLAKSYIRCSLKYTNVGCNLGYPRGYGRGQLRNSHTIDIGLG